MLPMLCDDNSDTCQYLSDGGCDDGGLGSEYSDCGYGDDCTDCGPRAHSPPPVSPPLPARPPPSCPPPWSPPVPPVPP
eukprot:128919-Prymnesium_polylepis.1